MDLSTLTIDLTTYFAFAVIVVTAIAAVWPVRKTVKLGNRS